MQCISIGQQLGVDIEDSYLNSKSDTMFKDSITPVE